MRADLPETSVDLFIQGLDSESHSPQSRREWCKLFIRDMLDFTLKEMEPRPPDLLSFAPWGVTATWLTLAKPLTDRCIICPHPKADHYEREADGMCWCRACNKGDMVGPCSHYFIAVHPFEPVMRQEIECRKCKLGWDSDAHRDEYKGS